MGEQYNDLFTASGVLLLTLSLGQWLSRNHYEKVMSVIKKLSERSYWMYLLHGSLILWMVLPMLGWLNVLPLNSLVVVSLAPFFCFVVYKFSGIKLPNRVFRH